AIPVCATDAAPSDPPCVVAGAAGLNQGTGAINPALPVAAERIDDSVGSRFFRGRARPPIIVHCLPGNALVCAPADDPVSSAGSPDEHSALIIHGDSVEHVVVCRVINKIVSRDPIRAAVRAVTDDAVSAGGSNHINAASRIGGDAVGFGVSTCESKIVHRL